MAKIFNQVNYSNNPLTHMEPMEYHVRGEKRNHRELFAKNIVAVFRVGDNDETRETSLSTFTESMKTVLKVESGTVADCIMVSLQCEVKDNRRKFRLNIYLLPGVETACIVVRTSYKAASNNYDDWTIHREPMWVAVADKISVPLFIMEERDMAKDDDGKYLVKLDFDFAFIDDNNLFPAQGPLPVHTMPDFRHEFPNASIKLKVNGQYLYYLRSLLKMASPILAREIGNSTSDVLEIENVSYYDMHLLLKLLYPASSAVVTVANAETVSRLAKRFAITNLEASAQKVLDIGKKAT